MVADLLRETMRCLVHLRHLAVAFLALSSVVVPKSVPAAENAATTNAAAKAELAPEVRFVTVAPSSYTMRYDSVRAGLGIALQLQRLSVEHALPVGA